MLADTDDRRTERRLAWLAALAGAVLAICVVGFASRPLTVAHFDAKKAAVEVATEVFVPPPQAPVVEVAPSEAPAEAAFAPSAPTAPELVPVAQAVSPLVAPVMPGVASLKPVARAAVTSVASPVAFTRGVTGIFPDPPYPRWARQQGMQGKLQLFVEVSPGGTIAELKVRETSGHALLDQHVLDWVKANWSWSPGARRLYLVPFVFELQ
jgi:protein TonB